MIRSVFAASRRDRKKAFKSRAWFNGEEVTAHCQYADDKRGVVLLLQVNEEGHHYTDRRLGRVAKEWRRGRVRIGPR